MKKFQKNLSEDRTKREKQINEIYEEISPSEDNFMISNFSEKLHIQITTASHLTKRLNEVVIKSVLRFGRDIRDMQYIQKRLADAAIDLFGIFANIARVENLIRNEHHSAEKAILISQIFSRQAERRILQNLNDVEDNQDDALSKLAEMLYNSQKYPFDILDY